MDSGYFVSILFMDILGRKNIQLMGFAMLTILYTVLALQWGSLSPDELFFVYAATFFFSNFGPNATTFILPSETVSFLCNFLLLVLLDKGEHLIYDCIDLSLSSSHQKFEAV